MKKLALILALVSSAAAQSANEPPPKPKAKATRVYDNDSLSRAPAGGVSSFGTTPAPTPAATGPTRQEQEKMWRSNFAMLRSFIKSADAKAALLKDEMLRASSQVFAPDATYYDPKRVARVQSEIDANNKMRQQLKKQLADLEEELRKKGLPAGWADPN